MKTKNDPKMMLAENVKHIDVTIHATGAKIGTYTVSTDTLTEQQVADYVDDGGIGSLADCCDWDGPENYEWTGDEEYEVRGVATRADIGLPE